MKIRFTKHATAKFAVLKSAGVSVSRAQVLHVIRKPEMIDYRRLPLLIAQGDFDATRVLRVVYRLEGRTLVIITFYPGRKSQYEKD